MNYLVETSKIRTLEAVKTRIYSIFLQEWCLHTDRCIQVRSCELSLLTLRHPPWFPRPGIQVAVHPEHVSWPMSVVSSPISHFPIPLSAFLSGVIYGVWVLQTIILESLLRNYLYTRTLSLVWLFNNLCVSVCCLTELVLCISASWSS